MVKIIFIDDSVQQLKSIILLLKKWFNSQEVQFEIIWMCNQSPNSTTETELNEFLETENKIENKSFLKVEKYEDLEQFNVEEFLDYLDNKINEEQINGNTPLVMLDLILNIDKDLDKLDKNEEILSMKIYKRIKNSCQLYSKYNDEDELQDNWYNTYQKVLEDPQDYPRIIDRRDILPSSYRKNTLTEICNRLSNNG